MSNVFRICLSGYFVKLADFGTMISVAKIRYSNHPFEYWKFLYIYVSSLTPKFSIESTTFSNRKGRLPDFVFKLSGMTKGWNIFERDFEVKYEGEMVCKWLFN